MLYVSRKTGRIAHVLPVPLPLTPISHAPPLLCIKAPRRERVKLAAGWQKRVVHVHSDVEAQASLMCRRGVKHKEVRPRGSILAPSTNLGTLLTWFLFAPISQFTIEDEVVRRLDGRHETFRERQFSRYYQLVWAASSRLLRHQH